MPPASTNAEVDSLLQGALQGGVGAGEGGRKRKPSSVEEEEEQEDEGDEALLKAAAARSKAPPAKPGNKNLAMGKVNNVARTAHSRASRASHAQRTARHKWPASHALHHASRRNHYCHASHACSKILSPDCFPILGTRVARSYPLAVSLYLAGGRRLVCGMFPRFV